LRGRSGRAALQFIRFVYCPKYSTLFRSGNALPVKNHSLSEGSFRYRFRKLPPGAELLSEKEKNRLPGSSGLSKASFADPGQDLPGSQYGLFSGAAGCGLPKGFTVILRGSVSTYSKKKRHDMNCPASSVIPASASGSFLRFQ